MHMQVGLGVVAFGSCYSSLVCAYSEESFASDIRSRCKRGWALTPGWLEGTQNLVLSSCPSLTI